MECPLQLKTSRMYWPDVAVHARHPFKLNRSIADVLLLRSAAESVYFPGAANAPFNFTSPLTVFGSMVISFNFASTSVGTSF